MYKNTIGAETKIVKGFFLLSKIDSDQFNSETRFLVQNALAPVVLRVGYFVGLLEPWGRTRVVSETGFL